MRNAGLATAFLAATLLVGTALARDGVSGQGAREEDSQLGVISRCMAYYAVVGGMDGQSEVSPDLRAVVRDLGTQLYIEGSRFNVDETTLQNSVVAALVSLNLTAREEGMDVIKAAMESECDDLVSRIRGMP
jgi:hypothetical protein